MRGRNNSPSNKQIYFQPQKILLLRQGWYLKERTKEKPILLCKTIKNQLSNSKNFSKNPKN